MSHSFKSRQARTRNVGNPSAEMNLMTKFWYHMLFWIYMIRHVPFKKQTPKCGTQHSALVVKVCVRCSKTLLLTHGGCFRARKDLLV
jgi:hypothetical protein